MFIQSPWLDGYYIIQVRNASEKPNLSFLDFRNAFRNKFGSYEVYCTWAAAMIASGEYVFIKDEFITPQALSGK